MPSTFQWFVMVLAVLSIWRTVRQFTKKNVSTYWVIVFTLFWVAVAGIAFAPKSADLIAQSIGVGRGADLFVYGVIFALCYAVYRLLVRTQKQHQEITSVVRRIGIMEAAREKKDA